ncbi:hypothetical protein DYB37_013466, partial [Aphanomyces astaci]
MAVMSSRYQWVLVAGAICCFLNVMYLASKYGMLEGLIPKNKALRRVNAADANARDATATSRRVVTPSETLHPLIAMPTLTNDTNMQRQVTAAMSWAWGAYRKHAFGFDSLNVKDMVKDGLPGHDMAISLVDSLDSLYIMGLQDEFNEAVDWAESNLAARFPLPPRVSIFETTIRNLGYCIHTLIWTLFPTYVAEFTTIQLEFKYLAQLTGKTEYHDTVELLMDKKATKYKDMYINAVNGIMTTLVGRTKKSNWLFLGELDTARGLSPKMDHLVCFVPGMLALGYVNGMPRSHLTLAQELVHTCFQVCMYNQMGSKMAPEIAYFNTATTADDIQVHPQDAFNILRPETVESLMIMYRVTKNETYRAWGKVIFDAFERNARLDSGGYSSVGNVDRTSATKFFRPTMDSFFMAETLKYFYLLFSDEET